MKKRLAILILCFSMILQYGVKAEAVYTSENNFHNKIREISFTDVALAPVDNWSSNAIYVMASIGAIKGFEGNFNLKSPVKNHEAMAVLFRTAGYENEAEELRQSVADFKIQNPGVYNDIDSWADGYMRLAVNKGLISVNEFLSTMEIEYLTNPNPFFRKDADATRGNLAKWMVKVFNLPVATKENLIIDFNDYNDIKPEDKPYLETALNYGILKGSDGWLSPYSTLSREEMAQMFYNVYKIWGEKCGYEVIEDVVSDIVVDTAKNSDGTKLNNTKTITIGNKKLQTKVTYNLNGEVVDDTIYSYNEFADFPVVKDKQPPSDSSSLSIGDNVVAFLRKGKVVCVFDRKLIETYEVLNTDGYKDSKVYSGKLYYYDKEDKTIIITNRDGEYDEIVLFPQVEIYKRENIIDSSDLNSKYLDNDIYVFTVKKDGIDTDRGYRIQVVGE